MIRTLLATTALTALMSGAAIAQENNMSADETRPMNSTNEASGMSASGTGGAYIQANQDQLLASNLIGTTVFGSNAEDAESIGEINDVIMQPSGEAEAVIIGVGGFLGIGEKEVAVSYDRIEWQTGQDGERAIMAATREELENAPAFDRSVLEDDMQNPTAMNENNGMAPLPGANDPATDSMTADEPMDTAATDENTMSNDETMRPQNDDAMESDQDMAQNNQMTTTQDPAMENDPAMQNDQMAANEGANRALMTTDGEELSADALIGTRVYGSEDEDLGEIGDVIVSAEGGIEAYIVDVGGFLGLGEKPVALDATELEVMRNDANDLEIHTQFTQAQLEESPAYTEESYEADPDSVMLR